MTDEIFINHIGTALLSWLNYISAVERGYVLDEGSIKYPVSEFIGTKIEKDKILLEEEHPNLLPRKVDLQLKADFDGELYDCAFEFKYIRESYTEETNERRRILDDIMRLKIFIESEEKRKAYLVTCGEQYEFLKAFQAIGWSEDVDESGLPTEKQLSEESESINLNDIEPEGFYTEWFDFKKKSEFKTIDLSNETSKYKNTYNHFFTEYKKNFAKGKTETTYRKRNPQTRVVYSSDFNNNESTPTHMKVVIWEIISEKK